MKLRYILFLLSPTLLLAGDETDIVPRAINFAIFTSIMYYLLADTIKNAYKGRIAAIADRLDSIQKKVKESIAAKEAAQARVEEAKVSALSLIEASKKEAQLISLKIANDTDAELQNLEKSFKEKIEIEKRQMVRDVIVGTLSEIFDKDAISIDKDELVKIVMKRVA